MENFNEKTYLLLTAIAIIGGSVIKNTIQLIKQKREKMNDFKWDKW